MAVTQDLPEGTDFRSLDWKLGSACGDNAMNWARAFCAYAADLGIDLKGEPEAWMLGWFANAIECAHAARDCTEPVVLPDGSSFFVQ